jgi:hypothetical protein
MTNRTYIHLSESDMDYHKRISDVLLTRRAHPPRYSLEKTPKDLVLTVISPYIFISKIVNKTHFLEATKHRHRDFLVKFTWLHLYMSLFSYRNKMKELQGSGPTKWGRPAHYGPRCSKHFHKLP